MHFYWRRDDSLKTLSECGFDAIRIGEKVGHKSCKSINRKEGKGYGKHFSFTNSALKISRFHESLSKKMSFLGVDILAPNCGIAPGTHLANPRALVEARDEGYEENY